LLYKFTILLRGNEVSRNRKYVEFFVENVDFHEKHAEVHEESVKFFESGGRDLVESVEYYMESVKYCKSVGRDVVEIGVFLDDYGKNLVKFDMFFPPGRIS